MRRLLFLAFAAAVAWLVTTNRVSFSMLDPRPVGTEIDGRQVVRMADEVEARFGQRGSFSDTLMLFGGDANRPWNQIPHAHLAGVRIREARAIARQHPDFHLCESAGALEAKQAIEPLNFIASDRDTRAALSDALSSFQHGARRGGDRTCITIRGRDLELESVTVPKSGKDLTLDMRRAYAQSRFVLVEEASIEDCRALLD